MMSKRTQPIRSRAAGALTSVLLLAALTACGPSAPSPDDVGERTAAAIRDAGSVAFTMTDGESEMTGTAVYDGTEIVAVEVNTSIDHEPKPEYRKWVVDGEYWESGGPDAPPAVSDATPPEELLAAWDWAQVQEDMAADATAIDEVGERSIDGVDTIGFEITSEDRVETWWIDDSDRLVEYEYEYDDGTTGSGALFDYGETTEITVE